VAQRPDLAHVDVRYIADLARIDLSAAELERFQAELDDILGYVAQLSELDTQGIEPMAHAMPRCNVMREDVPQASLEQDRVLANAPAVVDAAYIRVPVVIEEASS